MDHELAAIVTAIVGGAATLLTGIAAYRAAVARTRGETESRERKAFQDGQTSLREELTSVRHDLQVAEDNELACRELAARQDMALRFLEEMRRRDHEEKKRRGEEPGEFVAMPPGLLPAVPDLALFRTRQGQALEKMTGQIIDQVKEEAKKVPPPQTP